MPEVTDPNLLAQLNGQDPRPPAPQYQQPPAFIPGNPQPVTPIQQQQLQMDRERLRISQEEAARKANKEESGFDAAESERKAGAFLIRALGANQSYEGTGVGPRNIVTQAVQDAAPNVSNTLINSPERQTADSAQDEFIAASLRQDSGAAIPPEELERQRRIYFPMPGDTEQVIEQKRQARLRAIEGLKQSAGRLAEQSIQRFEEMQSARPPVGGDEEDNPFANIMGEDGQPLGPQGGYGQDPETGEWKLYGRVTDDRPVPTDPTIAAEAARQDELRGETNLIDLAGHGMTLGLSDEAAGVGASIAGALKGDFNLSENYATGRDVEQYRIDQARERYGTLGTAAEIAGGMGLPAGALAKAGRVIDAARGGATVGAVGGFGYGRGADESLINAGIGAVGGAALGAGAQRIGNAMVNRGSSQGAQVQRAADDLGIEVIPAVTGGAVTRGVTAGARQGFISEAPIAKATERMASQGQAARSNIAEGAGQIRQADEAGELVRKAANAYSKRTSEIGGNLYTRADNMAGGIKAPLPKAVQEADNAMAQIAESVGGKESALYKDLAALRTQMADGEFSIPGIRATRTRLREEMTERGLRGSYSDKVYNDILNAAEEDMIAALQAAGRGNAAGAMKTASDFWKARVEAIDEVLEPLLGKSAPRSGEQILSTLERMARPDSGNARNLARLMRAMPKEEAASIRATVINRLGRPTKGSSEAQDAFSFNTFLTNWNNMSMPAKRTMFPGETIEALEKLATVSQAVKRAGADMNTSNTGRAITSQVLVSGGFWLLEPMAAISLGGSQYAIGRLLASPRFARMLAGAPRNATAAGKKAWAQSLGQIAKAEPALAKDIKLFQDAIIRSANDNPAVSTVAAQDENQAN